jgi:hypothetical protein
MFVDEIFLYDNHIIWVLGPPQSYMMDSIISMVQSFTIDVLEIVVPPLVHLEVDFYVLDKNIGDHSPPLLYVSEQKVMPDSGKTSMWAERL